MWNINFSTPAKSMKGILLLFRKSDEMSSSKFYNPKIDTILIAIEGVPNQLYAQGMLRYQHWEEIQKYFGDLREERGMGVAKALILSDIYETQRLPGRQIRAVFRLQKQRR